MKIAVVIAALATATTALAVDVNVIGAHEEPTLMTMHATPKKMDPRARVNVIGAQRRPMDVSPSAMDIRIASKDFLNRPTALINKNTLATDNNIFISRSNLVFTQSDRLAMRKRVQEALEVDAGSAVLTKNVLRAVSTPKGDATLQTKASAVVAAKGGDQATLAKRIADFVDAVGEKEIQQEQMIQSQTPRGIVVMIGTKDILRQPTGIVNKNIAFSDNQVNIARSTLAPTQNDRVTLMSGAKVADAILPASAVDMTKSKPTEATSTDSDEAQVRVAFAYPKEGEADANMKHEQWGLWGPGWGFGWRYPLSYWNLYGAGLYGGGCGLGFAMGPFYYC